MSTIKKLAKNTLVLFISQVVAYILSFFYTIYSARYLGVSGFGILSFALAFDGIFSVLADLGLSTLTTRELSRDKSITNKYFTNIIFIKIFLSILTFFVIYVTINSLMYPIETIKVVYIIALSIIIGNFSMVFSSIFQAYEEMEYQSLAQILSSISLFLGIIFAIKQNYGLILFSSIYLVVSLIVLSFNGVIYVFNFPKISLDIDLKFWKRLIKNAIPLSLAVVFSTVAFRIDTVFLSILTGNITVGIYTAAYTLMQALLVIPNIFSIAILPIFSKFYVTSKNSLKITYKKSFKYLTLLGVPIAFGTTLLSNQIIYLVYGTHFNSSIISLKILIWTIPIIFLTYVYKILLVSINKQKLLLEITAVCMTFNIIMNLILIPIYSYIGASFVTVITELLFFLISFHYMSKLISKIPIQNFVLKPVIASVLMSVFLITFKTNLFLLIFFSIVIYVVSLILLKTFSKEDIEIFKQIIRLNN